MSVQLWVTTIQIGTKRCRIAHQGLNGFKDKPTEVSVQTFPESYAFPCSAFPSSLFISRKDSLSAFGFSAIDMYKDTKDGIFFENIIESLYYSKEFNEKTLIKDSTGTTHSALGVLSKFLKVVFEFIKEGFLCGGIDVYYLEHDTKVVLALPSVRADNAVSFFIKGWEQSGLPEDRVTTVTYPNAVLNYCLYLPPEQCNGISFHKLPTGDRVMVIGFEDELDSFNVYEKLENQSFKQVVNHLSGTGSKDAIMDAFDSLLSDLYGSWIWKVVKQNDESIWLSVVSYLDLWLNIQSNYEHRSMAIEVSIRETCDEHINMTLSQRIEQSEYASQVKLIPGKLRIDSNLIKSIFDKTFKKINSCIKYALTRSEEKEVNTIILAGNISNSPLLKCAIVTEFPNKHILAFEHSEHAALKGAVLFGHVPVVVSSIFCGAQVMVSR